MVHRPTYEELFSETANQITLNTIPITKNMTLICP